MVVLINISTSNIFRKLLLLGRYHQNYQVVFGATGMNGLNLPFQTTHTPLPSLGQ